MVYITAIAAFGFFASFLYLLLRQAYPLKPRDWLQYAFLARYQLISLALLLGFGWGATHLAPNLVGNLLILASWQEVALVTWFAILTAWVCFFTLRVLARSASIRLEQLPPLHPADGWLDQRLTRSSFYLLAALPLITAVFQASQGIPVQERLLGIGIGWLTALGSGLFQIWLFRYTAFIERWLRWGMAWLPNTLWGGLLRGYQFEAGHGSAIFFFLVTVLIYIGGLFFFAPTAQAPPFAPPALSYLLLLLILLGWLLPGVAFFFDRYRLPVGLALLAFSFLVWSWSDTDYFYPLQPKKAETVAADPADLTPRRALQAWQEQHKADQLPIVIVTTSGGGIKAAVWTASMLQALQSWLGEEFAKHIVLVSSVSGGSVGVLHYMDAYQPADAAQVLGPPTAERLAHAVDAASRPSLASAAWGLIYPDLWQYGFGNRIRNRGWAMEQAWKWRMGHPNATLADWRADIRRGVRPVVLFNSTIVENGALFVFTPLDERNPAEDPQQDQWHSIYFNTAYPTYTVEASTAARMSATFPYVSPIARPLINNQPVTPKGFHLADGGYFDNYGIVAALEWLAAVNTEVKQERRRVLLLRIESSPFEQQYLSDANDRAGWIYSVAGPLLGAVKSLFIAQKWRNDQVIELLAEEPRLRNAVRSDSTVVPQVARDLPDMKIESFSFVYGENASLSWQLAPEEINRIRCAADSETIRTTVQRLCARFYPADTPDAQRCEALPSLVELSILTPAQCPASIPTSARK